MNNRLVKYKAILLIPVILACMLLNAACTDKYRTDMENQRSYAESFGLNDGRPYYSTNYNLIVKADSIVLKQETNSYKEAVVKKGELIVVAEFHVQPSDKKDSLWTRVAHDISTQGWIRESELSQNTIPADPISQLIMFFSNNKNLYFLYIAICFFILYTIRTIRKNRFDILHLKNFGSSYPIALCCATTISATVYSHILHHDKELWMYYFYHPSLNPFELPWQLSILVTSVWGIAILAIATIDEITRNTTLYTVYNIVSTFFFCIICYILPLVLYDYGLTYPFLALMLFITYRHARASNRYKYKCGKCGCRISKKGICPNCGAKNI